MPLVLVVEDDPAIRDALGNALTVAGYAVQTVGTALQGLKSLTSERSERPDLVILDLGLPDLDGADALRMMRAVSDVPVIVATARRGEHDAIRLLNSGADDYMTKPFSAAHVTARVAAVLRRAQPRGESADTVVEIGPLRMDESTRAVTLDGTPLTLTRKEYDVLAYLAARVGRVVTRRELFTEVWQQPFVGADQTLDVHLSWLRRKLGETAAQPRMLRTIRGVGVMLVPPS
ncbi:DNA-binding response regulator [Catellatospora methionotrophica]|uniref:DNA-binding response regulator n=1 Tax=Catellatospora methionotrophica TaxID=121620 RepID=A0A8J3PIG8_9ACTN|nr:response regulator transcription factor [Catellatospora methionotrophica]GIG17418.1 DNA-binding response regulator [Catellatospora methionotrophica]